MDSGRLADAIDEIGMARGPSDRRARAGERRRRRNKGRLRSSRRGRARPSVCADCTGIRVRGVMTMAPFDADERVLAHRVRRSTRRRATCCARRAIRRNGAVDGHVERLRDRGRGRRHVGSPRNDSLRSEIRMIDETFHLTPLDVRRYEFGKALRGYDPRARQPVPRAGRRRARAPVALEPGSRRQGAGLPRAAARISRARQGDQRSARLRAAAAQRDPRAGGARRRS